MWRTLRDVLNRVVAEHCDSRDAQEIQDKLNAIKHVNNEENVNDMVKTLEEEHISAHNIFEWFVEVLKDPKVNRGGLVGEIKGKIPPAPGPVYHSACR